VKTPAITPDLVLRAYAAGYFPMAESAESRELFWVDPPLRGIFPLDGLTPSRSLRKRVRQGRYRVTMNVDFRGVMQACAAPAADRPETWINAEILDLYGDLHRRGHAHSVECWDEGEFAGGLYGVSLAGAFFGESMVTRRTDASKVALVHLVAQLRADGFVLLDTQFRTDHLASLGCIEVPKRVYREKLSAALGFAPTFGAADRTGELAKLVSGEPGGSAPKGGHR
jgi:leucyl/phenylalanyl-tRNA--protein transferase